MTNKELDNYMKTVNPNFDSHIEKGTIEMSNEYYNLLEEKMARLINQNKELKKQLEEYKKKLTIATKMEMKEIDKNTFVGIDYFQDKCIIYENQQKEFIKWLSEKIKKIKNTEFFDERIQKTGLVAYNAALQKYKKLIGDDE